MLKVQKTVCDLLALHEEPNANCQENDSTITTYI